MSQGSLHQIRRTALPLYAGMIGLASLWGAGRGLVGAWLPPDAVVGVAVGIGFAGASIAATAALERYVRPIAALAERFAQMFAGATLGDALLLALLSSVGEEMLFRGCLQQELGLWPAALLFGLVHTGTERMYLWWTGWATLAGLGLGWIYEQWGLAGPIAAHFVINTVHLRLLGRAGETRLRDRRPRSLALPGD